MVVLYELIELFPGSFKPDFSNKLTELFAFLSENKGLDEEEAAIKFFGNRHSQKYFNKLKNKLKSQLTSYLIVNPNVWVDEDYKALQESIYKNFVAYKVLLMSGSRKAAIEIAKGLLPKAKKNELHGLVNIIASDLQFHYSAIDIRPGLAKRYGRMANSQLSIIQAESEVRNCLSKIAITSNSRVSFSPAFLQELREELPKIESYLKLGSNQLNRLIYNIIVTRYVAEYDYENVIGYCNQALNSFPTDHPNYTAFRFAFLQKQIPALLATNQFEEAKELSRESGKLMPAGAFNWHLVLIRRVIVCFHSGDYQEAYEIWRAHAKYSCPYQNLAEYWNLLKGYIYFLIQVGKIEPYRKEKFSLGKFLNEMPLGSRDKSGININIHILKILILLQRGQFGRIIDQVESLGAYARTYTRNPETVRANIFINMIITMEAASFHLAATERKTKRSLKRLEKTPLKLGQNIGVELIPFSVLWEEVLAMLDYKFRGVKLKAKL